MPRSAGNGKGADGRPPELSVPLGDIKLLARTVQGLNPKDLRGLIDDGKKQVGSGVVAIVSVTQQQVGLAVGVTDDLTQAVVKAGAEALGGKGGGGRHGRDRPGRTGRRPRRRWQQSRRVSGPDGSVAGVRGRPEHEGIAVAARFHLFWERQAAHWC